MAYTMTKSKAERIAVYRKAYNEGRLTWAEYEAFFEIIMNGADGAVDTK